MVPDTQPWWSSIEEAEKAGRTEKAGSKKHVPLDSFREGFDKWPARLQKKAAFAVNPDCAIPMVNWAGWREYYMPGASNM